MRLQLNFSEPQIKQLLARAETAGITGKDDRAIILAYICQREELGEPVKRGGLRPGAAEATRKHHKKKVGLN